MTICREGKYTKYKNLKEDILTFVAKTDDDNYFKILEMVRKEKSDYNCHQCCEDKEEMKNFKTIYFIFYNVYGQPVKGTYINFDFENSTVTTGDRKYKVKDDREFSYKIQKTQIKAIDGINGFYKFIVGAMHVNSPFNSRGYGIIEKLQNQ